MNFITQKPTAFSHILQTTGAILESKVTARGSVCFSSVLLVTSCVYFKLISCGS